QPHRRTDALGRWSSGVSGQEALGSSAGLGDAPELDERADRDGFAFLRKETLWKATCCVLRERQGTRRIGQCDGSEAGDVGRLLREIFMRPFRARFERAGP